LAALGVPAPPGNPEFATGLATHEYVGTGKVLVRFCAVNVAELPKQIVSLALTSKDVNTVTLSTAEIAPVLSFTVTP